MAITVNDLTVEMFEQYGMTSLPPKEAFDLLDTEEPELIICSPAELVPKLRQTFYKREVYWALSPDNIKWYVYSGGWIETTASKFYRQEMTAAQISAIPQEKLNELFPKKKVYIRCALISNETDNIPTVVSITADSLDSYFIGSEYIVATEEVEINTSLWMSLSSVDIKYFQPIDTKISLAFSVDGGSSFQVYKEGAWQTISVTNVIYQGNTVTEVTSIPEMKWMDYLKGTLRVAIGFQSTNMAAPPRLYHIHFNYTQLENPTITNTAKIKIPEQIYHRCVLSELTWEYEEDVCEGIGFDDPNNFYNFYTTPNKIHLRVLDMGTLIGAKTSEIFKCDIVNTFEDADFKVYLTMKNSKGPGIDKGSYCLVPDTLLEEDMTVAELSISQAPWVAEYPLTLELKHGQRKTFFFKLTPTSTTSGPVEAKVVATSVQIN